MKTFIVPTDFSETSKNAAMFAAGVTAEMQNAQILLYNLYYSVSSDDDAVSLQNRNGIYRQALEILKNEMQQIAPNTAITCISEDGKSSFFTEALERVARHQSADMIIMGITGATRLEQVFMGSNTLDMVDKAICPVMIVPPDAKFNGIKNVLFTSDFKEVDKTTPVKPLQSILSLFNPFVHVVNVDSEHYVELTEAYKAERAKLDEMLQGYRHEFYFMRLFDFTEAISAFTEDYKIDLLITVPRNHSFLGGLFRSNYTKKLAYHSHVPIIAVHE